MSPSTAVSSVLMSIWCLALSGCALPQRGAISGGISDFTRFQSTTTGILPVALNPQYQVGALQTKSVQRAVSKALGASIAIHTQEVELSDAMSTPTSFPLTAKRLRSLSDELGLDGVVGVSISSWSDVDPQCGHAAGCVASVDLMISYAGRDPALSPWTVTGTWSAASAEQLDEAIRNGLPFLLIDLRYALSKSRISSWFAEEWKDGPQVTYIIPQLENSAGRTDVDGKFVDFHLTGIDDAGISSISVVNESNGFKWDLDSARNDAGSYPVYLASRVRVPLAYGTNDLALIAQSSGRASASVRRAFSVRTTARHELFAVSIGLNDYRYLGPVRDAAQGAEALGKKASGHSAQPFPSIRDEQARFEVINDAISKATNKLSVGDTVVVSFTGRIVLSGSVAFLALGDMEAQQPRSGSFLRIEDLLRGVSSTERVLILDICSDTSQLPALRRYLQASLPLDQMTHVRLGSCDAPLGQLAQVAASLLQRNHRDVYSDYSGRSFFMDFQKVIAGGEGDVDGERVHLAFLGTGSPVVVTSSVPPTKSAKDREEEWSSAGFNLQGLVPAARKAEVTVDPSEFYVVTYSTSDRKEAIDKARALSKQGRTVNVLSAKSGQYGVTIGHSSDVRGAYDQLRKAQSEGYATNEAYVLPRSRISRIEF